MNNQTNTDPVELAYTIIKFSSVLIGGGLSAAFCIAFCIKAFRVNNKDTNHEETDRRIDNLQRPLTRH